MTAAPQDIPVILCRPSPTARPVSDIKVEVLARSIADVGLRQPINVRQVDDYYEIRGGGHRHAAFIKLGRETIPAFVRDDDDLRAELAEIDENLVRHELTPIERDICIARRKAIYEALHPETAHGATGKGRPKSRHDGDSKPPVDRFTKDTADKSGQGERTVQRSISHVETIGEETLADLIDTPLNSTSELDALAKLSVKRRTEVIDRVKSGDDISAKTVLAQEKRDRREAELGDRIRELPDKRYGLIYCDIPRHFNVRSDETGLGRSPENHYPTMTFEETLALPVSSIAASDCILVFWSTAASLIDDIEIIAEWGFISLRPRDGRGRLSRPNGLALPPVGDGAYKTMQVWDKVRMGLGYWFRDRHEFILIGVRGNVVPPSPGTQDQSLFSEEKGEHSAKPDRVAAMIERLWPNVPKIELFARRARDGWDAWGNEAPVETVGSDASGTGNRDGGRPDMKAPTVADSRSGFDNTSPGAFPHSPQPAVAPASPPFALAGAAAPHKSATSAAQNSIGGPCKGEPPAAASAADGIPLAGAAALRSDPPASEIEAPIENEGVVMTTIPSDDGLGIPDFLRRSRASVPVASASVSTTQPTGPGDA